MTMRTPTLLERTGGPLLLLLAAQAPAQTPTWSEDIACIVYSHCTPCHRDGGVGHFSLENYAQAFMYRFDIRDFSAQRLMPPWPPDPIATPLAHERVLSAAEIDLIAAWVNAGAPEGDPGLAPPVPVYAGGHVIQQPDVSVRMDEFVIPPSSNDLYRCFVLPVGLPLDRFITGLEVVPGNEEVVHHVLVYQDTSGQAQVLDAADPAPGYTSFGGVGVPSAKLVGLWVPGASPYFSPPNMGIKLLAGADLVIQVHYPAGSGFQLDSTRINLQLSTDPLLRNLAIDPVLEHTWTLTNGPLAIPPNVVKSFHNQYTVPIPATITGIGPHAHLLCTSMRSYAVLPNNDTLPLIDIPRWDFHWQGLYEFRRAIHLPAGTVLHGEATYDNTVNNPNNPNPTPQWVFLGEATTDEMMLFYFAWTLGVPADTNIVIDAATHPGHHLDCEPAFAVGVEGPAGSPLLRVGPSPAQDVLRISGLSGAARLRVVDPLGRLLFAAELQGVETSWVDVSRIPRGLCLLEIHRADGRQWLREKLVLE